MVGRIAYKTLRGESERKTQPRRPRGRLEAHVKKLLKETWNEDGVDWVHLAPG